MRGVIISVVVALSVTLAAPVAAGPFEDGFAQSGDYATALRLWQPLAEQGHVGAQLNLGIMYDHGLGVPQDHAAAVAWYRKAPNRARPAPRTASGSCTI